MDGSVEGGVNVTLSLPRSFHVLIYAVWLIPFTPAAGVIPLDVPPASYPQPHPAPSNLTCSALPLYCTPPSLSQAHLLS